MATGRSIIAVIAAFLVVGAICVIAGFGLFGPFCDHEFIEHCSDATLLYFIFSTGLAVAFTTTTLARIGYLKKINEERFHLSASVVESALILTISMIIHLGLYATFNNAQEIFFLMNIQLMCITFTLIETRAVLGLKPTCGWTPVGQTSILPDFNRGAAPGVAIVTFSPSSRSNATHSPRFPSITTDAPPKIPELKMEHLDETFDVRDGLPHR